MFAVVLLALLISAPVRAELRDPNNSADYIILTSQEVLSNNAWIDSLLDYRAAQGRVTMAVTVEEIWDEFTPEGTDNAIRDFLLYAFANWQTPVLKDVFIIGHRNVVPAAFMYGYYQDDTYYSDFHFSSTEPGVDNNPLFRVGRLPWTPGSSDLVPNFLEKIRAFESRTPEQCSPAVQVVAGAGEHDETIPFVQIAESIVVRLSDIAIERDYIGLAPEDSAFGNREEILENLNAGPLATFLVDYCGSENWTQAGLTSDDIAGLTNAPCYSIYSGLTGADLGRVGTIHGFYSIMGEAILNLDGGAIACFGNSGVPWTVAGRNFEYGVAIGLLNIANVSIGDIWNEAVVGYVESHDQSISSPGGETLFSNVLLGDPATIIPGRTTSADPITGPAIPATIQIVGNYPNPFNPSTTIQFLMNRAGNARLTVYDITGRAVTTLADQSFSIGEHNITWNAKGQASGVYLVRLESAGQFSTHRVTLLK